MAERNDILFITPEHPPGIAGGVGTHVQQLTKGLKSYFRHIDVLSYSPTPREAQIDENIHVEFVTPSAGSTTDIQNALRNLSRLAVEQAKTLVEGRDSSPLLIHTHDWYGTDVALELGRYYDIPVVGTIHFLHDPCLRWSGQVIPPYITAAEAKLCQSADAIIGVSRSVREEICRAHSRDPETVHAVYNGYVASARSLTPELRSSARRRLGLAPDTRLVVYVGRFSPEKGILSILESVDLVTASLSNVCYLLVGRIEDEHSRLIDRHLSKNPTVGSHVQVLGWQSADALADIYAAADLALVPSVYETLGYTALDAIAHEVPLIASAAGGLRELVTHMVSGQLIPIESSDDGVRRPSVKGLVDAQIWAFEHYDEARRMALQAKHYVSGTMTTRRMVSETLAVYNGVMQRRNGSVN